MNRVTNEESDSGSRGYLALNHMKKLEYCVYVLKSQADGKLYIGFTTDLNRRLTEHIKGYSKATAPRRPFELIFTEFRFR